MTDIFLGVIACVLIWAVAKWRSDVAQAERRLRHKRQKCADVYNARLHANYSKWFDDMTKEGFSPTFLSNIRRLTPDEVGVEEWQSPEEYLKIDPDWHGHPDFEKLLAMSYTDEQRKEMKQPGWDEQRKLRVLRRLQSK
ncbi:MAG TPA: hypothetical protein VKT50_12135 [Candidatus Acidoferrales bacterium]|nr:hypothetical protein [Candidatus Acidoferrales bacterium]